MLVTYIEIIYIYLSRITNGQDLQCLRTHSLGSLTPVFHWICFKYIIIAKTLEKYKNLRIMLLFFLILRNWAGSSMNCVCEVQMYYSCSRKLGIACFTFRKYDLFNY